MGQNQRSQITMSPEEVARFLEEQRVVNIATIGPTGTPHLVAMWYAVLDGELWFETKGRSQKVLNLRRDPRISCLVEAGHTYDTLRGVELEGTGEVVEDPDVLWRIGVSVWERYNGPYSEEVRPLVEVMLNKRVAVRVRADRVRTWDHRKLGMPAQPLGGTTAAHPRGRRSRVPSRPWQGGAGSSRSSRSRTGTASWRRGGTARSPRARSS